MRIIIKKSSCFDHSSFQHVNDVRIHRMRHTSSGSSVKCWVYRVVVGHVYTALEGFQGGKGGEAEKEASLVIR